MRKIKNVLVVAILMLSLSSCSEHVANKLTNCAQVAALSTEYRKAGVAYLNDPSKENCTAYRTIADQYITAMKGCSTVARVTLAAVEDIRAALDCSKKTEEETAE